MTAFSPFIPHERPRQRHAGGDVRGRDRQQHRPTRSTYTLAGTLGNYGANSGEHTFAEQDGIASLFLTSSDKDLKPTDRGNLTIATDAEDVEHTDHHFRGQWFDNLAVFWKEFARPGPLPARHYDAPRTSRHMSLQPEHGTLAARVTIPAGEKRKLRFVISWSFPEGDIYWAFRSSPDAPIPDKPTPSWRNWYATEWPDSLASAREALTRWDDAQGARPSPSATASSARRCRPRSTTPPAPRWRCCAPPPSSASKAARSGPGRASTPRTAPAKAPAPTSGTTSRRCPTSSRRSSARSARPSSPTTSSRPAASPSARSCRSAPAST